MERPWVTPDEVRAYTSSSSVSKRTDDQLKFDIARAEAYVIYHTHNKFDSEEYEDAIPDDVKTAVILLAEAYAKQSILLKNGAMNSETFDDYSYSADTDSDIVELLGLATLLDPYILEDAGRVVMKLRKL